VLVVVEAQRNSSAMLAVQVAADLGHEVAAVPGRVTDRGARGTLELLRDGAHPVGDAEDVLELIGNRPRAHTAAV
jgi:DNA processing protein